jgi:hypothetical protein
MHILAWLKACFQSKPMPNGFEHRVDSADVAETCPTLWGLTAGYFRRFLPRMSHGTSFRFFRPSCGDEHDRSFTRTNTGSAGRA